MSYLIDTNVASELRKGQRAHPRVLRWFEPVEDAEIYLSVLVIGELRQGVERLRRRDPPGAAKLERWLHDLVKRHAERILPVDTEIAERWGHLNVPDQLPVTDGLLAATALVHSMTLVTRNVRDIERTGVPYVDPFT